MDQKTHLICESVQEITLIAWPVIYGKENKYDLDSRDVLETFRFWGEEFEKWWTSHNQAWIDTADYLEEIEKFTQKKISSFVRTYVEGGFTRASNLQEFTAQTSGGIFRYMIDTLNWSREKAFAIIRDWADEFWEEYQKMDAYETARQGQAYYDLVDGFLAMKEELLRKEK